MTNSCFNLQSKESTELNVFSGEEEEFAFKRAVSRLSEMQTDAYWKEVERKRNARTSDD